MTEQKSKNPWLLIGHNAYGETVEENIEGLRRVATDAGWQSEKDLPAWRACRVVNASDAHLFAESLADSWVSKGFGHNIKKAYLVCRLSPGQPVSKIPKEWGSGSDPRWKNFQIMVQKAYSNRVLRAWFRHRSGAPFVPKWEVGIEGRGGLVLRGVQFGLGHRIESLFKKKPHLIFHEYGLLTAEDAVTVRLPISARKLHVIHPINEAWLPEATTIGHWLFANVKAGKAFNAPKNKVAALVTPDVCPVVWAFPEVEKTLGPLSEAWKVLSEYHQGMVVFPAKAPSHAADLIRSLREKGRIVSRFKVKDHIEVWHWGLLGSSQENAYSFEQWSVREDPVLPAESLDDLNPKVPYRPLSKLGKAEGMASLTLEANMHKALMEYQGRHMDTDVDHLVADGLGLDIQQLEKALSPEQIDMVALARESLEQGLGFMLSDETGFGKGRQIAALALTGLRQGRTVVFVTLNPFLFTDFYRDLTALMGPGESAPIPTMLHKSAVLKDVAGKRIAKSLTSKAYDKMLETAEWDEGEPRLIFTTYSQLSRKEDGRKVKWLKQRMGNNSWLLSDESHAAAGSSNINDRLTELENHSQGNLFTSATYAGKASNLPLYRSVMNLPPQAMKILGQALAHDNGLLREALTLQMARSGRLMRREHPPVPPPQPYWIPIDDESQRVIELFAEAWQWLYESAMAYSKLVELGESAWVYLGGMLSRSVKEFSLQMKVDPFVEFVQSKLSENKKVVAVVDSTLEAALVAALTPDEVMSDENDEGMEEREFNEMASVKKKKAMITQGEGTPPLWKERLMTLLDIVCPSEFWEGGTTPEAALAAQNYNKAKNCIQKLPEWDLAPLDRIRNQLKVKNIEVGELSGRGTRLWKKPKGWEVKPRNDPDRNEIVNGFNRGDFDVVLVTRAGAAGISLHAGQQFKDQRVRCLVEIDIAANPINRVQFWGRVRRKDQVVEPEFLGLAFDTPEDRRVIERENKKRLMLSAHMGTKQEMDVGLISELGESIVEEWAEENKRDAFKIGVLYPVKDSTVGRVDRALIRSIVLPKEHRKSLINRLEKGIEVGKNYFQLSQKMHTAMSSRALRKNWWWGASDASTYNQAEALSALRLDLVERVWHPHKGAEAEEVVAAVQKAMPDEPRGEELLELWKDAWEGIKKSQAMLQTANVATRMMLGLDVGNGIWFTHPVYKRAVRAVIVGWVYPDKTSIPSNWALSQLGITVWAVGDVEPMTVSLQMLNKDKSFKKLGQASTSWFKEPPSPMKSLVLQGHPVQSAVWAQGWGVGQTTLIRDEDEGSQIVLLLPPALTWERAMKLPRDLISVDHAALFFKEIVFGVLHAATPHGKKITATATQGGVLFEFTKESWEWSIGTWLPSWNQKGFKKGPDGSYAALIPWKYATRKLYEWEKLGIHWRVESKHLEWYKTSSAKILKEKK